MSPIAKKLNILLVEDSQDDLCLVLRVLNNGGLDANCVRVENRGEMLSALQSRQWDVVLSDYNLPGFSGTEALQLLQSTGIDLPFIIVSGAIGEETAVTVMRAGAHDYIMKNNLARLVPAIERELREVQVRRARIAASEDLRLAAKVFESSVEGIVITDAETRILRVNKAFTNITGYTQADILGQTPKILRSGRHSEDFYKEMWHSINEKGYWQGEVWNRRRSGEIYPEWLSISVVRTENNEVSHYIAGFTDLSAQKWAEERIQHLTHYDALTDLPNRTLFRSRFKQPMVNALHNNRRVALLHLDLDRFIKINDTLGHHTGDRLLQQVSRRLVASIHDRDFVSRFGGDEFAIACPDLDQSVEVDAIAHSVMKVFSEPFWVEGREIFLTPSIGIAIFPDDTQDYDELVKFADTAVHHAKRQGGSYQFYHKAMNVDSADRLKMESALRRALDRQEFELYFQPQIHLTSDNIIGFEALLRWKPTNNEIVLPNQFIPLLEETGLIISVGEWVLRSACLHIRRLMDTINMPIPIAVNLSPTQFRYKDLVGMIRTVLDETGVDPCWLELEITETSVMEDPEHALETLKSLYDMGIRLAIDDFGTGYSSLSYLKKLPLNVLKIDQSFVSDIVHDKDDAAIVDSIIAMSHRLNLKVVAEGIEDKAQLEFLREHDCDIGQGFLYAQPMRADQVVEMLVKERRPEQRQLVTM
ncbi:MAG: EAL domain-containing protein [Gammaproteobacteria bacterium]|nr:EAL domain-containing protein [Gammaproteobacteria bacterium]MDH5801017.1 EAL domain-containing protein [Gammaproteobacteria bacterium]